MNQRSKQFSLVVSTIVFIGLIGTFFLGCVTVDRNVNEDLTRLYLKKIHEELDHFKRDVGRYPSSEENLKALVEKPANAPGWKGPYLEIFPMDSWGRPFIYRGPSSSEDSFELYSLGRDGREGTDDDVFFKEPPDRRRTKR
jgi:type II secretion system protein G